MLKDCWKIILDSKYRFIMCIIVFLLALAFKPLMENDSDPEPFSGTFGSRSVYSEVWDSGGLERVYKNAMYVYAWNHNKMKSYGIDKGAAWRIATKDYF